MYSAVACVVLFLSIGRSEFDDISMIFVFLGLEILYTYFPLIFQKTNLVDLLVRDVILIVIHMASLYVVSIIPEFYYASCVHTFCFLMQHLIDRGNCHKLVLHILTALVLVYMFVQYKPISSIQYYVFSALWPHVIHFIAVIFSKLYELIIIYVHEI
jgi:hypothetical protein